MNAGESAPDPGQDPRVVRRLRSGRIQELVHGHVYVCGDLPQQRRGDVATGMEGHGGRAAIGVPELDVRAAPAGLLEAVGSQEGGDLPGLWDRQVAHVQAT